MTATRKSTEPKTWIPMAAGTLTIIAGIVAIVAGIISLVTDSFGVFDGMPYINASANPQGILIATGAIAIMGGIFALRRRIWWLALVGAIFSLFFTIWPVLIIGGLAVILLAISMKEFKNSW
jgi:uncharacterized membrane protein HdeD (DUF308 family)